MHDTIWFFIPLDLHQASRYDLHHTSRRQVQATDMKKLQLVLKLTAIPYHIMRPAAKQS